jgi:hypothetical protein
MNSDEAIKAVDRFIGDAKREMSDRMERCLRKIGRLSWWEGWKASYLADEVLGLGGFWDAEWSNRPRWIQWLLVTWRRWRRPPFHSPDECSKCGQRLGETDYAGEPLN